MARFALAGIAIGLAVATAGCGGGTKTYSIAGTKTCLLQRGAKVGGKLDFVAQTATGGAFISRLADNAVTIVFGETQTDGKQLQLAYQRFALPNVRTNLADLLRRYNNAVTLWHLNPSDSDLALVVGCLH